MRRKLGELVPKEKVAVAAMVQEHLPAVDALAKAGYADPAGERDRFLARPEVQSHILTETQKELVSWHLLKAQSKRVLARAMAEGLTTADPGILKIAVRAAADVLGVIRRTNPASLDDRADAEDVKDAPLEELVRRLLDGPRNCPVVLESGTDGGEVQ